MILGLGLVATALPSASSPFEFTPLGPDEWLAVTVWNSRSSSEMFHRFSGLPLSLDEKGVLSFGRFESQLVEAENFTTGMKDPSFHSFRDFQSTDSHLGDVSDADVVGDVSNDNDDLFLVSLLLQGPCDLGD